MSVGTGTSLISGSMDILNNIAASMLPIQRMVSGFAYVMGIAFAFKAISSLKQYGESKTMMSQSSSMKEPMVYLFVAAMFIYFPSGLAVMLNTTFGSPNILAYSSGEGGLINTLFGNNSMAGRSLTLIIQTIGIIAFVRGWVLVARASAHGQQPGGTGKGLIHIFGGLLAMNIVLTMQIINNTIFGV
jgi:intracellular multiplication protein IcmC